MLPTFIKSQICWQIWHHIKDNNPRVSVAEWVPRPPCGLGGELLVLIRLGAGGRPPTPGARETPPQAQPLGGGAAAPERRLTPITEAPVHTPRPPPPLQSGKGTIKWSTLKTIISKQSIHTFIVIMTKQSNQILIPTSAG